MPPLARMCKSRVGNTLPRQLVAAGLKKVKGVTRDGCAHWIFEENLDETLPVLTDFLGGRP